MRRRFLGEERQHHGIVTVIHHKGDEAAGIGPRGDRNPYGDGICAQSKSAGGEIKCGGRGTFPGRKGSGERAGRILFQGERSGKSHPVHGHDNHLFQG